MVHSDKSEFLSLLKTSSYQKIEATPPYNFFTVFVGWVETERLSMKPGRTYGWKTLSLSLLLFVAAMVALSACVSNLVVCNTCDPIDPNVDADIVLVDLLFEGARLEPAYGSSSCGKDHRASSAGRAKAWTHWLAAGEKVCAYWDRLEIVNALPGKPMNTASCDLCARWTTNAPPCPEKTFSDGSTIPGILAMPGAYQPSNTGPQIRLFESQLPNLDHRSQIDTFGYRSGCETNDQYAFPFYDPAPGANVQLSMEAWPGGGSDPQGHHEVGDKANIISVENVQEGFRMPLRLLEPVEPFDPTRPAYHWKVEKTDGRWDEEFSTDLEITRIKIYKGTYVEQDTAGMDSVGQPVNWHLENTVEVVPQRIEFEADQTAYKKECLGRSDTFDGDYNLQACRFKDSMDILRTLPIRATPRYGVSEYGGSLVIEETLDWIVRFRTRGDFVIPELGPGERLAIEFTLRVR
jgi:hypothetical protein